MKGGFWIRTDLDQEAKDAFYNILAEFNSGGASVGGLGAIGYGWIPRGGFKITGNSELIPPLSKKEWLPVPVNGAVALDPPVNQKLKPKAFYHPHYFLKPLNTDVQREADIISHAAEEDALFSGTIKCRLTTKGPIFTADADNDNYFGMQENYKDHKNFGFFRLDGKVAIPGASLRGMVSSVYEALTHSCFRIIDQERYLSRSAEPEKICRAIGRTHQAGR